MEKRDAQQRQCKRDEVNRRAINRRRLSLLFAAVVQTQGWAMPNT